MPMYEFRCAGCGAVFEELVSSSSPAEAPECPSCGAGDTERVLSTFAVSVKGAAKGPSMPVCPSTGSPCAHAGKGGCGG